MLEENKIILDVSQIPPEQREKLAKFLQKYVELAIVTGQAVPAACSNCCLLGGGNVLMPVVS